MGVLFLEVSRSARAGLDGAVPALAFDPPAAILQLSRPSASKYRALAAWRHAVLLHEMLDALDDETARHGATCVYFTACDDEPPFSWSQSAERCPARRKDEHASWIKERAVEGAGELLLRLRQKRDREGMPHVVFDLLKLATRDSLYDVLKLDRENGSSGAGA